MPPPPRCFVPVLTGDGISQHRPINTDKVSLLCLAPVTVILFKNWESHN